MPERPVEQSVPAVLQDLLRRMRDVERRTLQLPDGSRPLETFDDGSPLGPTRFLDFGAGLFASSVGDDYVRVAASGGGAGGFDAICDCSLAASDPDNRLFLGIGEALGYLRTTLGITRRAFVLVRHHPTSATQVAGGNLYTETADVTAPDGVYIISAPVDTDGSMTQQAGPVWDHNGFAISANTWFVSGLDIRGKISSPAAAAKTTLFGSAITHLVNCTISPGGGMTLTSSRYLVSTGLTWLDQCWMVNGWLGFTMATNCTLRVFTAGTYNPSNGSEFLILGGELNTATSLGGACTWNLPTVSEIHLDHPVAMAVSTDSLVMALASGGAGGRYRITLPVEPGLFVTITCANTPEVLELRGVFGDTTLLAPENNFKPHILEGKFGALDLTGPAVVNITGVQNFKIRGNGVVGNVMTTHQGGGSVMLDYIAAIHSCLKVACRTAPIAGSKGYAFDAASLRNILDFAGESQCPVASTDAGAGNLIRVT